MIMAFKNDQLLIYRTNVNKINNMIVILLSFFTLERFKSGTEQGIFMLHIFYHQKLVAKLIQLTLLIISLKGTKIRNSLSTYTLRYHC